MMKLLSDQQYFTPLLTLCMPFWQDPLPEGVPGVE